MPNYTRPILTENPIKFLRDLAQTISKKKMEKMFDSNVVKRKKGMDEKLMKVAKGLQTPVK